MVCFPIPHHSQVQAHPPSSFLKNIKLTTTLSNEGPQSNGQQERSHGTAAFRFTLLRVSIKF
eukprot:c40043_g1_i1 orf=58-243(+)